MYNYFMFIATVEKENENNVTTDMIQLCVLAKVFLTVFLYIEIFLK